MGGEQIDLLIVLCAGEIGNITDVRLNGEVIGNLPRVSYHVFLGTPAQNVQTDTGLDLDGIQYRNTAMLHVHLETSDKLKGGRPKCNVYMPWPESIDMERSVGRSDIRIRISVRHVSAIIF